MVHGVGSGQSSLLMSRLSDIVALCESIEDVSDVSLEGGREGGVVVKDSEEKEREVAKLKEANEGLKAQIARLEETLKMSEERADEAAAEVSRAKASRDIALARAEAASAAAAAAAASAKSPPPSAPPRDNRERERERGEQEALVRELKGEAQAISESALTAMQGLLQCVGEQAGRIEAKCSLIQQQPAESPRLLDRITRCKRIAREDLPAAAEQGVRLRNKLEGLADSGEGLVTYGSSTKERFSRTAANYIEEVERLKDDYTNIELELDRIYEDVRIAQNAEAEAEVEAAAAEEERNRNSTRMKRVMMSPEPPQVRMFEESEAALEERRQHWSTIEAEAQRLTTTGTGESDSDMTEESNIESPKQQRD
eukprot:CAMPEP_0172083178 /NCGR_PEP_ID=MMETSP1043-20130122/20288_1 /TAXON_ID=464988 /ORGANISM="Hemiselmis andersenii, Strain CCMP441" /LENGTH=368 /DNA_ID=CAMNT_0012744851 /DNA_START=50 /DNA_END=1153 /DNA_ORIENTATION=-